jgi:hypothetical protein
MRKALVPIASWVREPGTKYDIVANHDMGIDYEDNIGDGIPW